jgi:uncharacterized membrane protein YkoI
MAVLAAMSTVHAAIEASSWITMSQAVQIAQNAVPGSDTPVKAELDDGPLTWEIKTFVGTTLWEVNINPETGAVVNLDDSNGGGAQEKIAEANTILSQSIYTLSQAIDQAGVLWPEWFVTEIDMEFRNGTPIFDLDLIRGRYKLETRIRVIDGQVIRESTHLLNNTSDLYNANIPSDLPGDPIDTGNFLKANQIVVLAQSQFAGAKAFEVELDQVNGSVYRYEIRLLQGNAVVKAKYHPVTGTLMSSRLITNPDYVSRVQNGVNNATKSLNQAIAAARSVVPGGFILEAELKYQRGQIYNVEFQTNVGNVEVKVNSTTGAVMAIQFQD